MSSIKEEIKELLSDEINKLNRKYESHKRIIEDYKNNISVEADKLNKIKNMTKEEKFNFSRELKENELNNKNNSINYMKNILIKSKLQLEYLASLRFGNNILYRVVSNKIKELEYRIIRDEEILSLYIEARKKYLRKSLYEIINDHINDLQMIINNEQNRLDSIENELSNGEVKTDQEIDKLNIVFNDLFKED